MEEKDTSSIQGTGWQVVEQKDTEEEIKEAEKIYREAGGRDAKFRSRKTTEELIPPGGFTVIQSREDREAEDRKKRGLEMQRLAEQAIEKIESGQQVSTAEREALARSTTQKIPTATEINKQVKEQQKDIRVPTMAELPTRQGQIITSFFRVSVPSGERLTEQQLALTRTGKPVSLVTKDISTGQSIRTEFDTEGKVLKQGVINGGDDARIFGDSIRSIPSNIRVSEFKALSPETTLGKRIERTKELERTFSKIFDPGIERIRKVASIATGGKGRPVAERGFIGKTVESAATFLLGFPFISAKEVPITTAEALVVGETFIRPKTREIVTRRIKPIAISTLKEARTPEFIGTTIAASIIGFVPKGTEISRAKSATEALKDTILEPTAKETLPSVLVRVRELKGAEMTGRAVTEGVRREAIITSKPILAKSELIDIRDIEKPDLFIAELKGERLRKVRSFAGREKETLPAPSVQIAAEEFILAKGILTPEQAKQAGITRVEKLGIAGKFIPLRQEIVGKATLFLQPLELKGGVPVKKPEPSRTTGKFRRGMIEGITKQPKQVTQILKLPTDFPILQFAERQGGKIIAVEIRKTSQGFIKTIKEKEIPEVFEKNIFGFGKRRITKEQKPVFIERQSTTESGGLVQILQPLKQKIQQKTIQKQVMAQKQERVGRQEAFQKLSELLGRKKAKKQGLFIIEEVMPMQRIVPIAALRTNILLVPISAQAQASALQPLQTPIVSQIQTPIISPIVEQVPLQIPIVSQRQISLQSSLLSTRQATAQIVAQASALQPLQESLLDLRAEQLRTREKITRKIEVRKGDKDKKLLQKQEKLIEKGFPSYDVQIRKGEKQGSKFVTVEKSLPRNKALARLKYIVDTYIEASGRIKPSRKQPIEPDSFSAPDLSKFRSPKRTSKLPRNTLIEKRSFRLDSPEEVRQISYFKILAEKKKALKNMIFQKKSKVLRQNNAKKIKQSIMALKISKPKAVKNNYFSTNLLSGKGMI